MRTDRQSLEDRDTEPRIQLPSLERHALVQHEDHQSFSRKLQTLLRDTAALHAHFDKTVRQMGLVGWDKQHVTIVAIAAVVAAGAFVAIAIRVVLR